MNEHDWSMEMADEEFRKLLPDDHYSVAVAARRRTERFREDTAQAIASLHVQSAHAIRSLRAMREKYQ